MKAVYLMNAKDKTLFVSILVSSSVTSLGDLLDLGQPFKACGNN